MIPHPSGTRTMHRTSRPNCQAHRGSPRHSRLALERLEDRCVMSGSGPAIPVGPLPAVVAGLTPKQVARADAVIDWNATMLQAIWNAATPPTTATRVMAMV